MRTWNADLDDDVDYAHVCEQATGRLDKLVLLRSTGEALSQSELDQRAVEARRLRSGKLSAELRSLLATASSTIDAQIWYRHQATSVPRLASVASAASARAQLAANRQAFIQANAATRAALLDRIGKVGTVLAAPPELPVVTARLPIAEVATLAALADVLWLRSPASHAKPQSTGYQYFLAADDMELVEGYSLLVPPKLGSGIRVGIHEDSGNCMVRYQHPAFSSITFNVKQVQPCTTEGASCSCDGIGVCRNGFCAEEHATNVASRIGARRDGEIRGAAAMSLWQANGGALKPSKLAWLAAHDVTVINDSEIHAGRHATNQLVRDQWITVVKAAGNIEITDPYDIPVDCIENTICVGAAKFSVGASDVDAWKTGSGGYGMAADSRWADEPGHLDAEKPDVVAPAGPNVSTSLASVLSAALWKRETGTSVAAPLVTGLVALMQEENPGLMQWPELARAIVMVSALRHNVIGDRLSRNRWHLDSGDEEDGAGVPIGDYARQVPYVGLTVTPAWFDSQGNNATQDVWVPAGHTIRAVLSWDYCVEGGASILSADFDLILIDKAQGTSLDYSNSFTNSVEMLEWKNTGSSRWVTLRLHLSGSFGSCGGVQREYAGLAWSVHNFY